MIVSVLIENKRICLKFFPDFQWNIVSHFTLIDIDKLAYKMNENFSKKLVAFVFMTAKFLRAIAFQVRDYFNGG